MSKATPSSSKVYGGRAPLILGISLAECIVATIMIILRVYSTKKKIIQRAGWSLHWTCLAWFVAFLTQIFLFISVSFGIGNHAQVLLEHGTLIHALKWCWIASLLSFFAIGLGKVAAISFLLAIQGPTFFYKRMFLVFLATFNMVFDITCLFETAFHCSPPSALWDATAGTCHHVEASQALGYFTGSWNAATDLALAAYPIVLFWNLQMPKAVKVALCLLLGLGSFAAVCSALKTWQISAILIATDPSYSLNEVVLWLWSEVWIVLIVTSVAPLWPLLRLLSQQVFQHSRNQSSTSATPSIPLYDIDSGHSQSQAFPGPKKKNRAHFTRLADTDVNLLNDDEIYMSRDITVKSEKRGGNVNASLDADLAVRPTEQF